MIKISLSDDSNVVHVAEVNVHNLAANDIHLTLAFSPSKASSHERRYLRYVSASGKDLLSLDIVSETIAAVELLSFSRTAIIRQLDYSLHNLAFSQAFPKIEAKLLAELFSDTIFADISFDFQVEIYLNEVRFVVSKSKPTKYAEVCSSLVLELDNDNTLVAILIRDIREHCDRLRQNLA